MATGTLAPNPVFTGFDSNGDPLSGGKLYTYTAGTTTPVATYTNVGLTVANANPIILDSAGRAVIFLSPGASYKFVLKTSADVTVWTQDNVSSVPVAATSLDISGIAGEALTAGDVAYLSDGSGGKTAGQWYKADADFAYASTLPEIGFVVADITSQASGAFRQAGTMTGLTGLVIGSAYYISPTPGAITATPQVNTRLVGSADTTTTLVVTDRPAAPTIQTTTLTGTQHNFALNPGARFLRCTNASLLSISGFAGAYDGQLLFIEAIGTGQVDLLYDNAGSNDPNRILTLVQIGPTSLSGTGGTALLRYDATSARWRLLAHEQGWWLTPTFAAGNFTSNSGTWVVDSGDRTTGQYWLKGKTLFYAFTLNTTTVTGAPTILQIAKAAYGGYNIQATVSMPLPNAFDGAVAQAYVLGTASATRLDLLKNSGAAWTAGANTVYVQAVVSFEVT